MAAHLSIVRLGWLPIVERELRISARSKSLHRARLIAVMIALAGFCYVLFENRGRPPEVLGYRVFEFLMIIVMAQSVFAGLGTLDCISREKREGTLGLLFLTSLSGGEIVFGKMAAAALRTVYRLLVFFPVLAFAFLLGGVERQTYLHSIAACLCAAIFSLSLAVYCSSRVKHFWSALCLWFGGILFISLGIPFLVATVDFAMKHWLHFEMPGLMLARLISPIGMYFETLTLGTGLTMPALVALYGSFAIYLILSAVLFVLAGGNTTAFWKQSGQNEAMSAGSKNTGRSAPMLVRNRRLNSRSPVCWMLARGRSTKLIATTIILSGLALLSFFWLMTPADVRSLGLGLSVVAAGHLALVFWMAAEGAAWIYKLRQSGELEMLLTTPIQTEEFWRGYESALLRKSLIPTGFLLFAYWCLATSTTGDFHDVGDWVLRLMGIVCVGLLLPLNMLAAGWAGAWFGAISKSELSAALSAIGLLAGTVLLTLLSVYGLWEVIFGLPSAEEYFYSWGKHYAYYWSSEPREVGFVLFCFLPWFLVARVSVVLYAWAHSQCRMLRFVVQCASVLEQVGPSYAKTFFQLIYRRPHRLLEAVK